MKKNQIKLVLLSWTFIILLPLVVYAQKIPSSPRSVRVIQKNTPGLEQAFKHKCLKLGDPVFIRIFKESKELEVWAEASNSGKYKLFRIYEIKNFSGELGPKLKQGDRQAPEGFYSISPDSLNPVSSFHLSFNIGYPNKYDRSHGYSGDNIFIHGSDASVGCFAMGDKNIEEIYTLIDKVFRIGQNSIYIHIFPFRMSDDLMKTYKDSPWIDFWTKIKPGYDYFEKYHIPPRVIVKDKEYTIGD